MIVTLTANPSFDRTIELSARLERGAVQRASATQQQPGGKGVNVSRALIASGLDTVAVLPGRDDDPMLVALRAENIPAIGLPIGGVIRANVTLTEPDGTTTKINEPGPTLTADDDTALIDLVARVCRGARWLVIAGSLPPGLTADFYPRLIRAVRATGAGTAPAAIRVAVDSSGEPLAQLISSGVGIDLVKPNGEELAELTGHEVSEEHAESAVDAARTLIDRGCRSVLATLGAHGAVLVTAHGAWHAAMPPIAPRSTVGAGDSSLAGYLLAESSGAGPQSLLAQSVAHGAAATALPGSTMPSARDTRPELATVTAVTTAIPTH